MRAGVVLKECVSFRWKVLENSVTENIATRISLSGMLCIEGFIWDGRKLQLHLIRWD